MADAADQEKGRQEEQMAGGPVSAGASNKNAPSQQPTADTSKQSNQDYEALVKESPNSTTQGKSMTTDRDMGTVGGGNIPGSSGSGASQEGVSTSTSTVESGGGSSGGTVGAGAPADRGSVKDSSVGTSPAATNTVDRQAQDSSGGRHPSQPQTAMGDRDATQGQSGDEVTDPMSSRAPDKIQQKQK
ncbi:MAG: hypothetical protein JO215_05030 [Ktedonobacteraceae bacterium]|nr:hypothetical protein [Ktedonobacteraceae bacterium]